MIYPRQTGVVTEIQKHRKRKHKTSVILCLCGNIPISKTDIIHKMAGVAVSKKCLRLSS